MRHSMTGFAARQGAAADHAWTWEMRGVNNKGLDLRLRLPDWIDGLESAVRKAVGDRLHRGSVQVGLRIAAEGGAAAATLDAAHLDAVLAALARTEAAAARAGLALAPSTAAEILSLRGVLAADAAPPDADALRRALLEDFAGLLDEFCAMRAEEGARLAGLIRDQLGAIAAHVDDAQTAADARATGAADRLRAQLARVLDHADGVDPDRLAQELALIAVRADVTEELDRLRMHVAAARDLLDAPGPVGRKLDFLCQEFNREANTLCAKSGDPALTRAGLALKSAIEQMREQIQNLE